MGGQQCPHSLLHLRSREKKSFQSRSFLRPDSNPRGLPLLRPFRPLATRTRPLEDGGGLEPSSAGAGARGGVHPGHAARKPQRQEETHGAEGERPRHDQEECFCLLNRKCLKLLASRPLRGYFHCAVTSWYFRINLWSRYILADII